MGLSKAGTLAIVCVQYTICASVLGERVILNYIQVPPLVPDVTFFPNLTSLPQFWLLPGPIQGIPFWGMVQISHIPGNTI